MRRIVLLLSLVAGCAAEPPPEQWDVTLYLPSGETLRWEGVENLYRGDGWVSWDRGQGYSRTTVMGTMFVEPHYERR